jgi:hypothetical protein
MQQTPGMPGFPPCDGQLHLRVPQMQLPVCYTPWQHVPVAQLDRASASGEVRFLSGILEFIKNP